MRGILPYSVIIIFLSILPESKHKKFGTPGQRATGAVTYSGPAVQHPWLNLSILIKEIPTLLTTRQRAYGRAYAGTQPACRNGFCLNFTALG